MRCESGILTAVTSAFKYDSVCLDSPQNLSIPHRHRSSDHSGLDCRRRRHSCGTHLRPGDWDSPVLVVHCNHLHRDATVSDHCNNLEEGAYDDVVVSRVVQSGDCEVEEPWIE